MEFFFNLRLPSINIFHIIRQWTLPESVCWQVVLVTYEAKFSCSLVLTKITVTFSFRNGRIPSSVLVENDVVFIAWKPEDKKE